MLSGTPGFLVFSEFTTSPPQLVCPPLPQLSTTDISGWIILSGCRGSSSVCYGMFSSSILSLYVLHATSNHPTPQHTQVEIIRNASDNCPPPSQWGQGVWVHTQAWLWALGPILYLSTFQLPHCSMGIKAPPSQGYFED